jgi:outer membrane protein TolC
LATVEIVPSDQLPEPDPGDVPPVAEALRQAESHRPEIERASLDLLNAQIAIQATHKALLPSLDVNASYSLLLLLREPSKGSESHSWLNWIHTAESSSTQYPARL